MGLIVVYLIIIIVYFCCPIYLKLVICAANIFLPDPIPCVDELLMICGLFAGN